MANAPDDDQIGDLSPDAATEAGADGAELDAAVPEVDDTLTYRGDPSELYEIDPEIADELHGSTPPLIVALDGYVDAGSGVEIAARTLLDSFPHEVVATFDADGLIDYRSRRPGLTFAGKKFSAYNAPHLQIHRLRDADSNPFLLFTGPEPDLSWEKFCAAVQQVIEQLGVRLTISLMAIPMGVPHTRPMGMSVHATRPDILPESPDWIGSIEVPGNISGLLEYRLGQAGHDALGFAVHVPHYLARSDFPLAARKLITATAESANLVLPTDELSEPIAAAEVELAEQMTEHPEITDVVRALEKQYDAFMSTNGNSLLASSEPIPTAEELGAQFEAYLANQDGTEG